jgi:hypothetical protein
MKEFFLILFFSKWVQLTPAPVDLVGEWSIRPGNPLSAITPGAAIHIDLARSVPEAGVKKSGLEESLEILSRQIPAESVGGFLLTEGGERIELDQRGFSLENDRAWLVLRPDAGMPTDLEFVEMTIVSDVEIRGALVYWKNWSK